MNYVNFIITIMLFNCIRSYQLPQNNFISSNKNNTFAKNNNTIVLSESVPVTKKQIKRSLMKISLFELFKIHTQNLIRKLVEEKLQDTNIMINQLFDPEKSDNIGNVKNIHNLHLLYNEIFSDTGISIESDIAISRPGETINDAKNRLFKEYRKHIESFCKNGAEDLNIVVTEDKFPIVFLPWLEKISFKDNGEIDNIPTYERILEDDNRNLNDNDKRARNRWDNIIELYLKSTGHHYQIDDKLLELKFNIACLSHDLEKISLYLNSVSNNELKLKKLIESVKLQLLFKYRSDINDENIISDIFKKIFSTIGNEKTTIFLKSNNYEIFKLAVKNDYESIFNMLWEEAYNNHFDKKEMEKILSDDLYYVFRISIENVKIKMANNILDMARVLNIHIDMLTYGKNYIKISIIKDENPEKIIQMIDCLWASTDHMGKTIQKQIFSDDDFSMLKLTIGYFTIYNKGLDIIDNLFNKLWLITNNDDKLKISKTLIEKIFSPALEEKKIEILNNLWDKILPLGDELLIKHMLLHDGLALFNLAISNKNIIMIESMWNEAGKLGLQNEILDNENIFKPFIILFKNNFNFKDTVNILFRLSKHKNYYLSNDASIFVTFTIDSINRLKDFSKDNIEENKNLNTALNNFQKNDIVNEDKINEIRKYFKLQIPRSCITGRSSSSNNIICKDDKEETQLIEEKNQLIERLFNDDKIHNIEKNIKFYTLFSKFIQQISNDNNYNSKVLSNIINSVEINSLDSNIKDVIDEIKTNIESKEKLKNIFKKNGLKEKITKASEVAGNTLTALIVGKHLVNGDIRGLSYDTLNLAILPKLGEKISSKILEFGVKQESLIIKRSAPIVGRAVGNILAFYGLEESIKSRIEDTDSIDIKIDNLNIATNSLFIAADIPAIVAEVAAVTGTEIGVLSSIAAPISIVGSISVIIVSQFIEAKLFVEKIEEQINLTNQEKHDFYWKIFYGKGVPEYINNDIESENIYKQYILSIFEQFKYNYNDIVISLPSILVEKREYATKSKMGFTRNSKTLFKDKNCIIQFLNNFFATQNILISTQMYTVDEASNSLMKTYSYLFTEYKDYNTIPDVYISKTIHTFYPGIHDLKKISTIDNFISDAFVMRHTLISTGIYNVDSASNLLLNIYSDLFAFRNNIEHLGIHNFDNIVKIMVNYVPDIICIMRNFSTIPSISVSRSTEDKCSPSSQIHISPLLSVMPPVGLYIMGEIAWNQCIKKTEIEGIKYNFESNSEIFYPYYNNKYSRILPTNIDGYNLLYGPYDDDITTQIVEKNNIEELPNVALCNTGSPCDNMTLSRTVEMLFLHNYPDKYYNFITYSKRNTNKSTKVLFHIPNINTSINLSSYDNIDVIFNGKNIQLISNKDTDQNIIVQNHYYLTNKLDNCKICKEGTNFFYVTNEYFNCSFCNYKKDKINIVVTQGNLTIYSTNVDSIIGNNKSNHIIAYARYIDGKGGNDVITVKNSTVIKGYFGDTINGLGHVLLPMNFSDVSEITYTNNTINICVYLYGCIYIKSNISIETKDGLYITPIKSYNHKVIDIQVMKIINNNITLKKGLDYLNNINNINFNISKQLLSNNYHITIGNYNNHIFYTDKEENCILYWKAPNNTIHSYFFDNINNTIIISEANGILDFSQVNITLNEISIIKHDNGIINFMKNGLNITLLPDYKNIKVTFNGKEYYKLQYGILEREYCSHSLKINARFSIKSIDLLKSNYNCFKFNSKEILFLRKDDDLILLSNKGVLTILNYYSIIHEKCDLSIKLNNKIIRPDEFIDKSNDYGSVIVYIQSGSQQLQIFHNQFNDNNIGLIYIKDKSVLNCSVEFIDNKLLILHNNTIIVTVEDWNMSNTRKINVIFYDIIIHNWLCIVSSCDENYFIMEFKKQQEIIRKNISNY
jgi:hypothetical protein